MNRLLPLLALLCVPLAAQPVEVADTVKTSFPAAGVAFVRIEARTGRVVLGPSADSAIHVTTIRAGSGEDEEQARAALELVETGAGLEDGVMLALSAAMPEEVTARAGFELLVPPGLHITCDLDSGSVEAEDIEGFLQFTVETGSVSTRKTRGTILYYCRYGEVAARACRGTVDIEVGIGPATCTMAELEPDSRVELGTDLGDVVLYLPASGPADLEISLSSGEIEIEDLYPVYETREPELVRARLGAGGVPVRVSAGAGRIRVVGR